MKIAKLVLALVLAALPSLSRAETAIDYSLVAVRFPVADFERSIAFYTKLGMKRGMRYTPKEQQITWEDPNQGPNIILYRNDGTGRADFVPGNVSLTFIVSDIQAVVRKLRSAGYPDIAEPKDYGFSYLLLIRDPDRNTIELVQMTGKGDMTKTLESMNSKPGK